MKHITIAGALLAAFLPAGAFAGPGAAVPAKTFTITIAAEKHDRIQTPVCVPLSLPPDLAGGALLGAYVVELVTPDDKPIIGQLTGPGLLTESAPGRAKEDRIDLHFILPALKAGQTLTLKAALHNAGPTSGFSWHDKPGQSTELRYGSRPVLRYMYKPLDESSKESRDETFKVFHHLFDPSGRVVVTKGPGGLYTHHRGLFFGFKCYYDGKMADTWHCPPGTHLAHEKFLSSEVGPVLGRHRVRIGWHGPKTQRFAEEERELTVYHVPGGQMVEFASKLTSKVGALKVGGDPQHAGFHFRADQEVAAKGKAQTYYLRPDGKGKPGETRNWDPKTAKGPVNLPWNAMSFMLGPQRYTVAYLDRPANPKEARYSERDYGRFGSYFETELSDKKPLVVAYRVWLQEGEMTGEQVAAQSANFVSPPATTVK